MPQQLIIDKNKHIKVIEVGPPGPRGYPGPQGPAGTAGNTGGKIWRAHAAGTRIPDNSVFIESSGFHNIPSEGYILLDIGTRPGLGYPDDYTGLVHIEDDLWVLTPDQPAVGDIVIVNGGSGSQRLFMVDQGTSPNKCYLEITSRRGSTFMYPNAENGRGYTFPTTVSTGFLVYNFLRWNDDDDVWERYDHYDVDLSEDVWVPGDFFEIVVTDPKEAERFSVILFDNVADYLGQYPLDFFKFVVVDFTDQTTSEVHILKTIITDDTDLADLGTNTALIFEFEPCSVGLFLPGYLVRISSADGFV